MEYDHREIEKKWQARWEQDALYRTSEAEGKEKAYVLDMFPYPSGEGLHVGHPKGYIATDIYSRKKRMEGFSVLHPMGWDAFGLPAENFAIKNKVHPRTAVEQNIANFKAQLAKIGFDYDWTREINTTGPDYYKWTQWIFLKMFEHGLAYQSNEPINWCPSCMTGLANEDLDGNVCERCGTVVLKKRLPQWILKITDYADRMLEDLTALNWPEHIKEAQRNWIGRSEGAEITFLLNFKKNPSDNDRRGPDGERAQLMVFTTRPDTIYGATYLVVAPEHPWVQLAIDDAHDVLDNKDEVRAYVRGAEKKTEIERGAEGKEKSGVELRGVRAINPATKEEIPMYVADYVLGSYGTGAVMAVPAHDERDYEFAKKFNLPIRYVIDPVTGAPQEDPKHKDKIVAVVEHNGKLLTIRWPDELGGRLLIGGTAEEGEEASVTGAREIAEETGYTNLEFIEEAEETAHHSYYAFSKKQATVAHSKLLHFRLKDESCIPQKLEADEQGKFAVEWVSKEQALREIHDELHQRALERFLGNSCYTGDGILARSGEFDGKNNRDAMADIVAAVGGKKVVRYKLRDWVFSRQRYWGEPIPIIHCEKDGAVPVPYEDLPVELPQVDHYEPTGTGESPLAAITDWVNVPCPKCGGPAKRETNTMPQWAGSSWYYLRFMDPHNADELVSKKNEKYWAPVDVYVGGDHAVRHLIYARFWHKFLYDIAVVSTKEPFARLEFLGFILAEDGRKMSKRFGNVINPDDVVGEYGADAFRAYEMFMGPFENTTAWSTTSIAGTARFIARLWNAQELVTDSPVAGLETSLHQTIKKVGEDIEAFKFNTAVSQAMIFLNALEKEGKIGREQWSAYLRLLAPFSPHITEELWEKLGEKYSIHQAPWPVFDPTHLFSDTVEVVVQVNGKRRGSLTLATDASEAEATAAARALPAVATALEGKEPKRVVYVMNKILNMVV
jgi:leucyl-tRNA synthetase